MINELVLFTDGNIQLEVPVSQDGESVWLSANQIPTSLLSSVTVMSRSIKAFLASLHHGDSFRFKISPPIFNKCGKHLLFTFVEV